MKEPRNEKLSEHLSDVDPDILATAYEVDDGEKLKAYVQKRKAQKTPFYKKPLFRKIATAAACFLLVVGIVLSAPAWLFDDASSGPADVDYKNYFLALAAPKLELGYKDLQQEGYEEFLEKIELFAAKLTAEVYADSDKQTNVCISPVSVYMALALAVECADGETRAEILDAVGVTYDEVDRFTKYLYAYANRKFMNGYGMADESVTPFEELANSIWADDAVVLKEAGVENLANSYHCDLFRVDFESGEGGRAIAAYVKEKTHGLIDGKFNLPPETLITLVNTFYLKDAWNSVARDLPFTDATYRFQNAGGSTVETKLLEGYYFNGKAYKGEGYTSFFTRTQSGFTIHFMVPEEGYTLDEVFTAENIYRINNITDYGYKDVANRLLHHTRVLFPEYAASYAGDLTAILQNDFGILSAFDIEKSDFSNICAEDLALRSVQHKCVLQVSKKGIEGGAASAMDYGGAGQPTYTKVYHDYIVDRAFGFVITDGHDTVLFSGAVNTVEG